MSSQVISADNTTVVIQVNPLVVQDSADGQEKKGQHLSELLKGFLKGKPTTLGTVQIMNGVIIFLFGILLSIRYPYISLTVCSGITLWGPLIYISAGCLSVAGENKLHFCVVLASFGMNSLSAMTTGAAIILMSCELSIGILDWSDIAVSLVFTILQFIISIGILIVVCTATFDTSMVNVQLNQSSVTEEEISMLNIPQLPRGE